MKSIIKQWQQARHEELTSKFGDLALEALLDISEETKLDGVPGSWQPNYTEGTGLVVTLDSADGAYNEAGQRVIGKRTLKTDVDYICFNTSYYAMATAQPGSPYLLAVYNEKHESLTTFSHVECYNYADQHIYNGKYKQVEDQSFMFHHTGDVKNNANEAGRKHQSVAIIEVSIAGKHYELRPFTSGQVDIVVFRDQTSDEETYSVGRMLVIEKLDGGAVRLDFNKAFLPPCAFSPHFNCPMPPFSNRIEIPIRAGEINVKWK